MVNETKAAKLEAAIRELTRPIKGQYPRPWLTNSREPASSKVFVVGMNDAKIFRVDDVGSHDRFMDAHFNRHGEGCYQLFYDVTSGPYHTRDKIDDLIQRLEKHGVTDVLSTNVICYSTPQVRDLRHPDNAPGVERGRQIFEVLFRIIEPKVVIVHGVRSVEELSKMLNHPLPRPPTKLPPKPVEERLAQTSVFVIPSFSPRAFYKWSPWANKHLEDVCRAVATRLG